MKDIKWEWSKKNHVKAILQIEDHNNLENALTEKQLDDAFGCGDYIGKTYTINNKVVGFAIYQLYHEKVICYRVESINNDKDIYEFIINDLMKNLHYRKRPKMFIDVDERKLDKHLLLKELGFKAILTGTKNVIKDGRIINIKTVNRYATKDGYDTYTFEYLMSKDKTHDKFFGDEKTDGFESDLIKLYDPDENKYKKKEDDGDDFNFDPIRV